MFGSTKLSEPSAGGGADDAVHERAVNTLAISLPASHDRRRRLLGRLEPNCYGLSFVQACYPPMSKSMSDHEWALFHEMAEHLTAGQRGCFLSHRRAWLSAVESTAELTIILEDDAIPLYKKLPSLPDFPEDLDVLYLHHFAQYIPSARRLLLSFIRTMAAPFHNLFEVRSIDEVVASHCGKLNRAAMPGSAYAVTRKGAEKLLSIFDEVGLYYQWDSVMLRHSLSSAAYQRMLPWLSDGEQPFYVGQRPQNAPRRVAATLLNAYAIYPPITMHDYLTPSARKAV